MENNVNVVKLNNTINELEKTTQDMMGIKEVLVQIEGLYKEVAAAGINVVDINEHLKSTSNIISNSLNSIQNGVEAFREENSKLYKETQYEVFKGLERHRSDLQIDIRSEGTQIERTFQNILDKHFLELDKNIRDEFSTYNKKIEELALAIDQASLRHDKYFKLLFGFNTLILIAVLCAAFI